MENVQELRAMLAANIESQAMYGRIGYVYGYPHKKAYRPLTPPRRLADVWAEEPRQALFCYVHIPFCHQRCSFCNLFTFVPADTSPVTVYLDALAREMEAYERILRPARFRRLYLGGGTPTFLNSDELRRLAGLLHDTLGVAPAQTHSCIEASPETLDEEKVGTLRELGFQRLSLGIQSLVAEELRQVNRRFDFMQNRRAIDLVGQAKFPHFNIDLIYGLPGQTEASWCYSLDAVVDSPATSLFLYPLYIRPLTGLDRRADALPCPTPAQMGRMYDVAIERLTAAGFRQLTMRQFRRDADGEARASATGEGSDDLEYRCQRDGMVGLGAGARSYTQALHYSTPWRMVARNIRSVVEAYCRAMQAGETDVRHGFVLDADEQQRRHVILSLLYEGLDLRDFTTTFGVDAYQSFQPQWEALDEEDCVRRDCDCIRLTARGVCHADIIGQLFFSERVRRLIETYEYDA
ncbi:MAG TPA: STM4012 family radical SAM protein [Gemmataceae bacterium]